MLQIIHINSGCLSLNFLYDCEFMFLMQRSFTHQKLEICYQNSMSAVSTPDLEQMRLKQGKLQLAFAPRDLPDWLGCCYPIELGGCLFLNEEGGLQLSTWLFPWQLAPSLGKVANPAVPWWQALSCSKSPLHPPQYCQFEDLFEQQSSSTHRESSAAASFNIAAPTPWCE